MSQQKECPFCCKIVKFTFDENESGISQFECNHCTSLFSVIVANGKVLNLKNPIVKK